jgi:hypothetical protein
MRKYEEIPVQWQTEGPLLGSRLNEMPDEDFPNEDDESES